MVDPVRGGRLPLVPFFLRLKARYSCGMNPGALRALEFDRVTAALRSFALTPLGATRLDALSPLTRCAPRAGRAADDDRSGALSRESAAVSAARADDLEDLLAALRIDGALPRASAAARARGIPRVDRVGGGARCAGRQARSRACAASSSPWPRFADEIGDVRRKIGDAGDVLDHASPALQGLRDRLRKQRSRLRSTLESYLRGRDTAKYLQEQVVTERNGRFVILVRAEHRSSVPGIVHGSSASGATLFVEPLGTVEVNNDIVALEEEEAKRSGAFCWR